MIISYASATIMINIIAFIAALVVEISVTYILIKIIEKCFKKC